MGVVVGLTGTGFGNVSDMDGKYEITGVSAGTFEIAFTYSGYKTYKQSITVGAQDITLDMKMMPEMNDLTEHVVKSGRITNTENAVISEIRSSSNIVSGTSAAQISKTMDRNAADVVRRIPGITIQDDRFIVIRGLPDRYNNVWLNDASTPSSEADKKSFSFDIIPAGLIDRLLVYKAPTPDLPGDFAGGMVKVYTVCLAEKNQFVLSLSTSGREYTTGSTMNYNKRSSKDWLGYDDGSRSVPKGVPDYISTKDPNYKAGIGTWSKAFGNDWVLNTQKVSPDVRFSAGMSKVWNFRKFKVGNTFGVLYASTFTNYDVHRQDWDSASKNYNYMDKKSVSNVNAGFMDDAGIVIGNSKIEFRNLYNQAGSSAVTIRNSLPDTTISSQNIERSYAMWYESKATYAAELSGTNKSNDDTRKYTWTLGYTDLFKNMPDLRRITYSQVQSPTDTYYHAQISNNGDILNGGRYYSTLYEHTYSFNHQYTQTITLGNYSFDVNVGNYIEFKNRSFRIRQLAYTIKAGTASQSILRLPVNEIFADSNADGVNRFKIGEITNPYDHYVGKNELIAGYLAAKLPIGKRISVYGGARYEYNVQSISAMVNLDTVNPKVTTKYLLPSVNATYNLSDRDLLRFAYGKTLNRPEFREWAPVYYYDFDELAGVYGSLFPNNVNKGKINDTLKVAQIQNFDLRYEFYPANGEMVQVGAFYKSFRDPIQRVIYYAGGLGYSYINSEKAYCYGLEIDVRKSLGFLDSALGTRIFSDLAFVGNLSLTKSELTTDSSIKLNVTPKSVIQGQSPYIVNLGFYYQNATNGFQGSLLYNVFGPRMYALGATTAESESIGELPFQSLDFAVSKTFLKFYSINFGIQNLLGSGVRFVKDINKDNKFDSKHDREEKSYFPGRYYTLGIKVKL